MFLRNCLVDVVPLRQIDCVGSLDMNRRDPLSMR